jgi:hypothetical protein
MQKIRVQYSQHGGVREGRSYQHVSGSKIDVAERS